MQRDEAHALPDACKHAFYCPIVHFSVSGVSPPNQHVGVFQDLDRQAVLTVMQSRRVHTEIDTLAQAFSDAFVHPFRVNFAHNRIFPFVDIFVPDEDADWRCHNLYDATHNRRQRWNALSSTRCVVNAAVRPIIDYAFGGGHRLEDKPIHLQAKPFWNQDAIEQIEEPLHEQREHSCGDRAL
jgi:hypothetical protein